MMRITKSSKLLICFFTNAIYVAIIVEKVFFLRLQNLEKRDVDLQIG